MTAQEWRKSQEPQPGDHVRLGRGDKTHLSRGGIYVACGQVNTHYINRWPHPRKTDLPITCEKCLRHQQS